VSAEILTLPPYIDPEQGKFFDLSAYSDMQVVHDNVGSEAAANISELRKGYFPPDEAFIQDPTVIIDTPVDSRGLVRVQELLEQVTQYVRPGYKWRGEPDDHHLYWFAKIFNLQNLFVQDTRLGTDFRTLPLHIIEIPRELHNLIHAVTRPVEAPNKEVMEYRVESWQVASNLFKALEAIEYFQGLSDREVARRINNDSIEKNRRNMRVNVDRAKELPPHYRFFKISAFNKIMWIKRPEEISGKNLKVAKRQLRIGRVSTAGALKMDYGKLLSV
jgi:hypothetical protein